MATFEQEIRQPRDVFNIVVNAEEFARRPDTRHYLRMLAVLAAPIANADGSGPPEGRALDLWGEWERLRAATERARDPVDEKGAPWAVVRLVPPSSDSLHRALLPREPGYQVLHISGHGSAEGLVLEDDLGRERLITVDDLVKSLQGSTVQLVVLNACASVEIGRALVERAGVPCAVATQEPIDDREAQLLSEQLYGYLAAGACVGEALGHARQALVEAMEKGDLPVIGDPQARAANLTLIGHYNLRLAAADPPAREPAFIAHPVRHNNPLPFSTVSGFVGRTRELLTIARWLAGTGGRAFAVSGIGGVGKTSLALNAALRHAHRFKALVFVSAKDQRIGPLQVLQALSEALGLAPQEERNPVGEAVHLLNTHATLLVLDNLESLTVQDTGALAQVLQGIDPHGGTRVLMTLRPREKDPLTALVDRRDRLDLPTLDRADAVRLAWEQALRQGWASRQGLKKLPRSGGGTHSEAWQEEMRALQAQARLPGTLVATEIAALDELATYAFDHPKLIELAAALLADNEWEAVIVRLKGLQGQTIEQALEGLIGSMLDDLLAQVPEALALLHAALAFVGGADGQRLCAVTLGDEMPEDEGARIDLEERLLWPAVRANLLSRNQGRYDLDPPVRAYLERRRPPKAAEMTTYRLRHAAAHLSIVAGYNEAIKEGRMTYSAPLEWSNVSGALEWLAERVTAAPARAKISGIDQAAAKLLIDYSLHMTNVLRNSYDPRRMAWLQAAREAARRSGDRPGEASALKAIGVVQRFRDEYEAALANYEAALELYRAVGDRLGEATALNDIGHVQRFRKESDAALASYEAALELYRAVGARLGEASARKAIGDVQLFREEYEAALASYEAALELYRAVGARLGEANTLDAIGDVQRLRDEYEAALASYEAALGLYRAVGERVGEATALNDIGHVQRFLGKHDAALASYEAALELYRAVGDRLGEANTLTGQGRIALGSDQAAAERLLEQALGIYRAVGDGYSEAAQIGNFGWELQRLGRQTVARPYLLRAADLFAQMGLDDRADRHREAAGDGDSS